MLSLADRLVFKAFNIVTVGVSRPWGTPIVLVCITLLLFTSLSLIISCVSPDGQLTTDACHSFHPAPVDGISDLSLRTFTFTLHPSLGLPVSRDINTTCIFEQHFPLQQSLYWQVQLKRDPPPCWARLAVQHAVKGRLSACCNALLWCLVLAVVWVPWLRVAGDSVLGI